MSWPAALEVLLSLTLQAAALYAVTLAMQRRASSEASKDYVWKAFYLLLLTLTALAWFGPHLRFVSPQFLLGNPRVAGSQVWQLAISRAVVWLWGGGVLIGAISLVLGIVAALRELRTTVPLEETQLAALLPGDADFQASARGVEFRTGSNALHPYCWQFSRPVVVLPCHLWQAPAETIRPIILHELAHLRANHPLHLFLQHIVEILFWYHPAIWQASRRANLQREIVADHLAVQSRDDAVHYLKGLLLLTSHGNAAHGLPAGLALLGENTEIQERVKRLVERPWDQARPSIELRRLCYQLLVGALCLAIWVPVNPTSSARGVWSPWPEWSAMALHGVGIRVRDYEIDAHRLAQHHHTHDNSRD